MVMKAPEPQAVGRSYFPNEFWEILQLVAEKPILQLMVAALGNLDDRTLEFLHAYISALETVSNSASDVNFEPTRVAQLAKLAAGLMTSDAESRNLILSGFDEWRSEVGEWHPSTHNLFDIRNPTGVTQ